MNFFSRFLILVTASLPLAGSALASTDPYWRLNIANYGLAIIPYAQVPSRCVWKSLPGDDRSAGSITCSFTESEPSPLPYEESFVRKVRKTLDTHCWWGIDGWNSRVYAKDRIQSGDAVDPALFTSVLGCRFVLKKSGVSSAQVCVLEDQKETCSAISIN